MRKIGTCAFVFAALSAGVLPPDTLVEVCTTAEGLVNSLSATTQKLLNGVPTVVPAPPPSETPKPSRPPALPAPPAISTDAAEGMSYPLRATSHIAPLSPPLTHDAVPPTGTSPGQVPPDSGSAQALPVSSRSPAKLPLLLSAIALSFAAAALARTWLRRRLN